MMRGDRDSRSTATWSKSRLLLVGFVLLSVLVSVAALLAGRSNQIVVLLGHAAALADRHFWLLVVLFTAWSFLSQLVVAPTGSITVAAAGFLIGGVPATLIYYLAQVAAAPIVYGMARGSYGEALDKRLHRLLERLPGRGVRLLGSVREEGVLATVMLRQVALVPSAAACLIAAAAGISFRALMIGSLLSSWVRPLFFAYIGASVRTVADLAQPSAAAGPAVLVSLAVVSVASVLLLAVRLVIRMRVEGSES